MIAKEYNALEVKNGIFNPEAIKSTKISTPKTAPPLANCKACKNVENCNMELHGKNCKNFESVSNRYPQCAYSIRLVENNAVKCIRKRAPIVLPQDRIINNPAICLSCKNVEYKVLSPIETLRKKYPYIRYFSCGICGKYKNCKDLRTGKFATYDSFPCGTFTLKRGVRT